MGPPPSLRVRSVGAAYSGAMTPARAPLALALRRALLAGAGLAATLAAHVVAGGGHGVGRAAPVALGTIVFAAMLLGPRRAVFAPRSVPATLAILLALQAVAHAVMWAAPWAVGLPAHAHAAPVTSAAVLVHLTAALLLAVMVRRVEVVVAAALVAVRVVRAWFAASPRARTPRTPALSAVLGRAAAAALEGRPTRGPPAPVA